MSRLEAWKWLPISFLLIILSLQGNLNAQTIADKSRFLVDSLDLEKLDSLDRAVMDSCLNVYHNASHDTTRLKAILFIGDASLNAHVWPKYAFWLLRQLERTDLQDANKKEVADIYKFIRASALSMKGFYVYMKGDSERAVSIYYKAIELYKELGNLDRLGILHEYIGAVHGERGKNNKAIKEYEIARELYKEAGNIQAEAQIINNIGTSNQYLGNIERAISCYHQAISLLEQNQIIFGLGSLYSNIGMINFQQDEDSIAMHYMKKAIENYQTTGEVFGEAKAHFSMAKIYLSQGQYDTTRYLLNKSEQLMIKAGRTYGLSQLYEAKGTLHNKLEMLDSALFYYNKALNYARQINDRGMMSALLANVGDIYLKYPDSFDLSEKEALQVAQEKGREALSIAKDIQIPPRIEQSAKLLSNVAKKLGRFEDALEMYELQIRYRDTIANEENRKAALKQQAQYEFEKEQLIREQEEKEIARIAAEAQERRNNLQYSIILVGIILFFMLVLGMGLVNIPFRLGEGLIFLAFLILFEFLLVLTDPFVDEWTGGAPGYKLLINAGLAAMIFPANAFFERMLKRRLLKKQKNDEG